MKIDVAKHDQFQTPGGKIFQQFRKFRREPGVFELILFAGWGSTEAQDIHTHTHTHTRTHARTHAHTHARTHTYTHTFTHTHTHTHV